LRITQNLAKVALFNASIEEVGALKRVLNEDLLKINLGAVAFVAVG
jgi:hypothetical protein